MSSENILKNESSLKNAAPLKNEEVLGLKESLKELQDINEWFDSQQEVDVEAGLEKIRRGVELLKTSKARLGEIENEFIQIRGELEG